MRKLQTEKPTLRQRYFGKSFRHQRIQHFLKKKLLPENIQIEHPFPQIKRIADLVWLDKKIIFEIQCSSISTQEIAERNRDYKKLGFTVVWILHDRKFNRYRLTAAENSLRYHPHYFVRSNLFGKPTFYDQYAWVSFNKRSHRSAKYGIDLSHVSFNPKQFPSQFPEERKAWGLFVKGDLYNRDFPLESIKKRKFFFRPFRTLYLSFLEKMTD